MFFFLLVVDVNVAIVCFLLDLFIYFFYLCVYLKY